MVQVLFLQLFLVVAVLALIFASRHIRPELVDRNKLVAQDKAPLVEGRTGAQLLAYGEAVAVRQVGLVVLPAARPNPRGVAVNERTWAEFRLHLRSALTRDHFLAVDQREAVVCLAVFQSVGEESDPYALIFPANKFVSAARIGRQSDFR